MKSSTANTTKYDELAANIEPDGIYVQTCTAHGRPLLYGPFESHDEAQQAEYTYRDKGVHNPPPREVLIGWEFDRSRHADVIREYLAEAI